MRNGSEIEITGGFKYGLTDEFKKLLKASRQINVVHLNSFGGRIGEAEKLYTEIHDHGLTTYVSSNCASACTLAFAGGRQRYVEPDAHLGFHAPSFPGITKEALRDNIAMQSRLFIQSGFSQTFVIRALNTPSSSLWEPTIAELLAAKAITGVSDGTQFSISGFGNITKESLANVVTKALPLFAALKRKYPNSYDDIIKQLYASYLAGETRSQALSSARAKLMSILEILKPLADEDVLVDLAHLIADELAALNSKGHGYCYFFASDSGKGRDFTHELPAVIRTREQHIYERVVLTAAKRVPPSDNVADASWVKLEKLLGIYGVTSDKMKLLSMGTVPEAQRDDYCATAIGFYRAISSMPQRDAALVMRNILASK
jgi:hypothetical protein